MEENILGIINILWILFGMMVVLSTYCLFIFVRAVKKDDEAPKKIIELNTEFIAVFFLGIFFLTLYVDIEMSKSEELMSGIFFSSFALLSFQLIISKISEIYSGSFIQRKIEDIMIKDGCIPISRYRFKNQNDEEFDVSYSLDKEGEIEKLYMTYKKEMQNNE